MAFEAGDYGRDEDETLAEAQEIFGEPTVWGRAATAGSWGWDRWMDRGPCGRVRHVQQWRQNQHHHGQVVMQARHHQQAGRGSAGLHAAAAREDE